MDSTGNRKHGPARRAISAALTIALASAPIAFVPSTAAAVTSSELQSQLDAANQQLDALYFAAEQAEAELDQVNWELEQTRGRIEDLHKLIEENKIELSEKQVTLSQQVVNSYKGGNVNLIDVIFESTSFEDFVSRITYANKMNQYYIETIADVRTLREALDSEEAELAERETSQIEQQALQEQKLVALEASQQQQAAYIDSLSEELRAAIEEERRKAEEEARRAAEEAARRAAEEAAAREAAEQAAASAQQQVSTPAQSNDAGEAAATTTTTDDSDDYEPSYTPTTSRPATSYTAPVASTATSDQRQIAIDAALAQLGLSYIWGGEQPGVGFDCSGLTHYAWAQAGVEIPGYSFAQYQWLLANGRFTSNAADLQPGDLVLYSYDGGATTYHVALYLGGGQVVHANGYRWGVMVSDIYFDEGFIGGGSPI